MSKQEKPRKAQRRSVSASLTGSALRTMSKEDAREEALAIKDKWEQIVTDAFRYGYLTDRLCSGCGKYDCGGCPCGTSTGWMPGLDAPNGQAQPPAEL